MLLFSRLATGLAITTATRRTQFLCKRNFVVSTALREKLTQEQENQKTFSNQHRIPRLPIPTLQETADRYVQSLRPLLPDNEYEQATNAVNTFIEPGGFGGVLQRRLQELDSKEEHSWLEKIWLRKGYLEWREPSYINVNWWAQFKDSPEGSVASQPGKISEFQIRRAAGLISNMLNFNDLINREELPPDVQGKKQQPLCMNQYRNQFGTARIAEMPADRIQNQYPCTARHIMVIIKDQNFKVDVISAEGKRLPVRTIESQLEKAVKAVDSMFVTHSPPVGVLTSEHRDVWAKARASLSHEAENRSNLDIIDTAIFVVCLEHAPGGAGLDDFHPVLQHNTNGRNRWYDKSLQLIIANDGKAGFNGEHTPADAVIPGEIANFIVKNEPAKDPVGADAGATVPIPQSLKWVIPADVQRMIQEAEKKAAKLARDIDSKLLHYSRYGSEKLKQAKISPDAYIQMALQLVYYRLFSVPCPTYESASSRAFLHGRTETVRSCSVDSVRFTQAFDNSTVKKEEKVLLFQKAINSHLDYMKAASSGKGVDRHLLGLRCMIAGESELSRATLFTDSSYIKSMYFKLSSSNMSPGDYLWGGFAPVTPEGFGVNYAIGKDNIKFSVSTWKSTRDATSADFRDAIRVALDDLERVFVS